MDLPTTLYHAVRGGYLNTKVANTTLSRPSWRLSVFTPPQKDMEDKSRRHFVHSVHVACLKPFESSGSPRYVKGDDKLVLWRISFTGRGE